MIVGYVRVSTDKQGLSVEAQVDKIKSYAKTYDLDVSEIFIDEGCSAKNLERPELQKILSRDDITGLIFTKLDRLTRSVVDLGTLLKGRLKDVRLISLGEHIDSSNATGRMMLNVLMSVSEWEREVIGERTKTALAEKKRQGFKLGGSLGLSARPEGQEAKARVKALRAEGLSFKGIQDRLNAEGFTVNGVPLTLGRIDRLTKAS